MSKEVKRFYIMPGSVQVLLSGDPAYTPMANHLTDVHTVPLVMASDYDALLAENETLRGLYKMHQQTEAREMRDLRAERDALLAERDSLKKDAERYRWLRMADWWNSPLCVIRDPKQQAKPGTDCPSRDRLDEAIDAALQGDQK